MTARRTRIATVGRLCLTLLVVGLVLGCAAKQAQKQADDLSAAGRWEEAIRYYREAVARNPRNVEARLGLARAMLEASNQKLAQANERLAAGNIDEATLAFQEALAYNAENQGALEAIQRLAVRKEVGDHLARARELMQRNEWRAALAEASAALRLDAGNGQAALLRQQILQRIWAEPPAQPKDKDADRAAIQMFPTTPVTLRFRDTDIKEVLEVFARTAGINVFTDESLPAKRVTTYFKDLPLREAFELILSSNRLFAKAVAKNTVIVVPDNPAKRQQYDELMVQTFYLTEYDAKVAVNLLRTILNTRQVFVNEKLNALVVRDTPDKIELARKLLEANDRGAGEVEVELEVLEVDLSSLENLGIDLSPRTLSVALTFPSAGLPVTGFWAALKAGTNVILTNPSLILNLVKTDGSTKILANPTIRILDRQKARLLIGERRPFLISSLTSVPATAAPGTTPTGAVSTTQTNTEYRDVGLKVTLTPTVHLNGEVTIELNFEISAVGAPITSGAANELLVPVNTRNLDTFVKTKNGETRLLGGLLQETEQITNNPIPGLSDIPGIGRIFNSSNIQKQRNDILISITPRVVKQLVRPDPDIESFISGTADSFGGGGALPALPTPQPVTPAPPRPATPGGAPGTTQPVVPIPGQPGGTPAPRP
jgi:general secretion pathway protein D